MAGDRPERQRARDSSTWSSLQRVYHFISFHTWCSFFQRGSVGIFSSNSKCVFISRLQRWNGRYSYNRLPRVEQQSLGRTTLLGWSSNALVQSLSTFRAAAMAQRWLDGTVPVTSWLGVESTGHQNMWILELRYGLWMIQWWFNDDWFWECHLLKKGGWLVDWFILGLKCSPGEGPSRTDAYTERPLSSQQISAVIVKSKKWRWGRRGWNIATLMAQTAMTWQVTLWGTSNMKQRPSAFWRETWILQLLDSKLKVSLLQVLL